MTTRATRSARRRVLVVEDDYYVADSLALALESHGFEVLGPVATVQAAADLIAQTERIDGAVLDVNLKGEPVYPVAEELRKKRVPFVFTTGYDAASIARREPDVVCLEKPVSITQLIHALFD